MATRLDSRIPALLEDLDGFRVVVDAAGERADIILDRPPMNVVSMRQRAQLCAVFEELEHDDRVRVIVIRAEGANFSSGGNIRGFMEQTPETVSRLAWNIAAPERCHKPVVAAVQGYCFGVAFELVLACDFRLAGRTAQFALPEQRIGMIPGSGGSVRLLHMIGIARTKDLAMRGRRIGGEEAHQWGIVNQVVADNDLETTTDTLVRELCVLSPLAQRTLKGVLNVAQHTTLQAGIELEGQAYGRLRSSDDFREGVESFHEKRAPRFRGS